MQGRLARERDGAVGLDECAPSGRDLRFAKQNSRQNEIKYISAAIPDQRFELGAIVEPILQSVQIAQHPSISAVLNRDEIVGIVFRKERVGDPEIREMNA